MFGLMRARCCSTGDREAGRLHYCGTCKTMGRLFGQRSRMLLDYDAVFLGELLAALSPQPVAFGSAYTSRSCLALPAASEIPWSFRYAAAVNVVLADLKLADHQADTRSRVALALRRFFSGAFRKAAGQLRDWEFPLGELRGQLALQWEREREARPTIDRLAEPTANATRLVFRHGAGLSPAGAAAVDAMGAVGDAFGRIAYLIDAIEDREKDARAGAFNALAATGTTIAQARTLLADARDRMVLHLGALPIAVERRRLFAARLNGSLAPFLGRPQLPVIGGPGFVGGLCCDCCCNPCSDTLCQGCCESCCCWIGHRPKEPDDRDRK
jgi:hypothetical protein